MRLLVGCIILMLANYSSCQQQIDSIKTIEGEILAVNRLMETGFNKGNYAKIGEFYADSAAMVGNKVEVIGQDNLIAYWRKFENAHSWKLENIAITVLGENTVLQRGYSNMDFYHSIELQKSRSIFSLVWVKTDEGWKIILDHFSPR